MYKHFFLLLFFLVFIINLVLSGLFYYIYRIRKVEYYKTFGGAFFCFGLFFFFWYLGSYLVLNVSHRESFFYTTLEALALLNIGISVYLWMYSIITLLKQDQIKKYLFLIFIATGILILIKYSGILGIGFAALYWVKLMVWLLIILVTWVSSVIFLINKRRRNFNFPKIVSYSISLVGLVLPFFGLIDYFLIRDKFYEGEVRLSMNFPVFILGYFLFSVLMIRLLIIELKEMRKPQLKKEVLVDLYQITPREAEIIDWVLKGKSNQEIAELLFISPATVKNHLHHIFQKTGSSSRYELINLALSLKDL